MQWENPPKIEWQTTLLQEKHRSCILWFSMQSLCWAKARAQPDRPSGAILAAVSAAVDKGGQILVARNCHKAVYHAIYLRELSATYI